MNKEMKELLQTIEDTMALQRRKRVELSEASLATHTATVELMRIEKTLQGQYKKMQTLIQGEKNNDSSI